MWRKAGIVVAVLALGLTAAVGALASPTRAAVDRRPPLPPRGLPFTGSHLLAYTSLGVALLAGGLLLRQLTRRLSTARAGGGRASREARALPDAHLQEATASPPDNGSVPAMLRPFSPELLLIERHRRVLQIGDAVGSGDADAIVRLRRELGEIDQLLYRDGSGWQVWASTPATSADARPVGGGDRGAEVLRTAGARPAALFSAAGPSAGRKRREREVTQLAASGG